MIRRQYRVEKGPRPETWKVTILATDHSFLLDGPGLDEVVAGLKAMGWCEVQ